MPISARFKTQPELVVSFFRSGASIIGLASLEDMMTTITPAEKGPKPLPGQKWQVRLESDFIFDPNGKKIWATGVLLHKDGQALEPVTTPATFEPLDDDVEWVDTDLDLEIVRGKNTKSGADQWEKRVYDKATGVTTLYVVDRNSQLMPKMNGERYAALAGRQLYPQPGSPEEETTAFVIQLVELIEKLDPNAPPETRRRIRRNKRTRMQIRATRVDRRAQAEKKEKGKGQKKARA